MWKLIFEFFGASVLFTFFVDLPCVPSILLKPSLKTNKMYTNNFTKINYYSSKSDAYLSRNTWKAHEEFSLMIDDLNRDIPHPGRRRHQTSWITQKRTTNNDLNSVPSEQQISIANGIFYQNGYSIRPDFRNAIESSYKNTLQRLDFANKATLSTKYINRFVLNSNAAFYRLK